MKIITHVQKNVNRRIGMIVVVIALSLGLIGSAVAMYSDTLTANHNINTGSLDVQFSNGCITTMSLEPATLEVNQSVVRQFSLVNKGTVPVNFKDDSATSLNGIPVMVNIHWPTGANATLDPDMPMNVLVDIMPTTDVPGTYKFSIKITAAPWNGYTDQWTVDNLQLEGSVTVPEPVIAPEGEGGTSGS